MKLPTREQFLEVIGRLYIFIVVLLLLIAYLNIEACSPFLIHEEEVLVETVVEDIIIYEIKKGEHNHKVNE